MVDNMLADAIEEFLGGRCTPQRVREIEAEPDGQVARALWDELLNSGFVDALIAEAQGGAGLGWAEAAVISVACGRHAMPLPMPLTMIVRAALAASGKAVDGTITIASTPMVYGEGPMAAPAVPWGLVADWVLVRTADSDWLLPTMGAIRERFGGHGSLAADIRWRGLPGESVEMARPHAMPGTWRATAAALVAAQMAGAMERLLEMTIRYANDRSQFGKPIGKLQAIQQQISVMAEQVFAARTAALVGLSGGGPQVDVIRAAIAKARAGEAAVASVAISHAVHGAIGVTEEFDLQLYTRRLHEWRGQYGGESFWHEHLGHALLDGTTPPLEFVQQLRPAH